MRSLLSLLICVIELSQARVIEITHVGSVQGQNLRREYPSKSSRSYLTDGSSLAEENASTDSAAITHTNSTRSESESQSEAETKGQIAEVKASSKMKSQWAGEQSDYEAKRKAKYKPRREGNFTVLGPTDLPFGLKFIKDLIRKYPKAQSIVDLGSSPGGLPFSIESQDRGFVHYLASSKEIYPADPDFTTIPHEYVVSKEPLKDAKVGELWEFAKDAKEPDMLLVSKEFPR